VENRGHPDSRPRSYFRFFYASLQKTRTIEKAVSKHSGYLDELDAGQKGFIADQERFTSSLKTLQTDE
jgi:hypothetical protein